MSRKVIVTDVSPSATEKNIRDFFLFCGKIREFELVKAENTDKQIAYVTFERESAAKTALMLTNAVVGDSQITVKSADDNSSGDEGYDPHSSYEHDVKPNAKIFAEIIAAGHQLTHQIIEKGICIDQQYGLSATVKYYLTNLHESLKRYDEQYRLSETLTRSATDLDQRYGFSNVATKAVSQAQDTASHALQTPAGKKISDVFDTTSKAVSAVYAEARRIVDERRLANGQLADTSAQPDVVEAH